MFAWRQRRTFWLVVAELALRPAAPEELAGRIARHTFGAFRPTQRKVTRAARQLLHLRMAEYVGASGLLQLSETGRAVAGARARAMGGSR